MARPKRPPARQHRLVDGQTRQTDAQTGAKAGAWNAPARFTRDLYGAYPSDLLEIMQHEPDTTTVLMLIGHEPTWSETIEALSKEEVFHFPTAAMARIDLPIDTWGEAAFGHGTLVWLQKPRELAP